MPVRSAWMVRLLPPQSNSPTAPRAQINQRLRRLLAQVRPHVMADAVPLLRQALLAAAPQEQGLAQCVPDWTQLNARIERMQPERDDVVHLGRLLRLAWLAEQVFGDRQLAWAWLSSPKRRLHGLTPLAAVAESRRALAIERWLTDIADGNPS